MGRLPRRKSKTFLGDEAHEPHSVGLELPIGIATAFSFGEYRVSGTLVEIIRSVSRCASFARWILRLVVGSARHSSPFRLSPPHARS